MRQIAYITRRSTHPVTQLSPQTRTKEDRVAAEFCSVASSRHVRFAPSRFAQQQQLVCDANNLLQAPVPSPALADGRLGSCFHDL